MKVYLERMEVFRKGRHMSPYISIIKGAEGHAKEFWSTLSSETKALILIWQKLFLKISWILVPSSDFLLTWQFSAFYVHYMQVCNSFFCFVFVTRRNHCEPEVSRDRLNLNDWSVLGRRRGNFHRGTRYGMLYLLLSTVLVSGIEIFITVM